MSPHEEAQLNLIALTEVNLKLKIATNSRIGALGDTMVLIRKIPEVINDLPGGEVSEELVEVLCAIERGIMRLDFYMVVIKPQAALEKFRQDLQTYKDKYK